MENHLFEAAIRARRGAAWLDKNCPGWVENIDLGSLDMEQPRLCALSQVTGTHYEKARVGYSLSHGHAAELGFARTGDFDIVTYRQLTDAWRELILDGRPTVPAVPVTVDSLLDKHAARLQKMYDDESIGDYSFYGALSIFLREVKESGVQL